MLGRHGPHKSPADELARQVSCCSRGLSKSIHRGPTNRRADRRKGATGNVCPLAAGDETAAAATIGSEPAGPPHHTNQSPLCTYGKQTVARCAPPDPAGCTVDSTTYFSQYAAKLATASVAPTPVSRPLIVDELQLSTDVVLQKR